ncbi:PEP-CTERM sorting domain-containing protein [Coraliomargarita akajimensis]|nr:PEP-CTERM sorting domain-containing protein [Coraliomargarita akajimensis]
MSKYYLLPVLAIATSASLTAQNVIFQDDFSSYGDGGSLNGANWNPKWQTGTNQQNLIMGTGSGTAAFDLSQAERNYHMSSQYGFSLTGSDTASMSIDFRYTHNDQGNLTTNLNTAFFQLGFTTSPDWYDGANKTGGAANRGDGLGLAFGGSPWVGGNELHLDSGIDTSAGGTSQWFTLSADVTVVDGTYWLTHSLTLVDGTVIFEGPAVDTGTIAGTEIYSLITTGWNNVGPDALGDYTNITGVEMDNFVATSSVPEPSAYALLVGAIALGSVITRRRAART